MKLPLLAALLFALPAQAQNNKPMWDSEADFRRFEPKVLELIVAFNREPLGMESEKRRFIINSWAAQTPYIGFTRYAKYISELDRKMPYYDVLIDAFTFGEMELKLTRKDAKPEESEIAQASLGNMLKVYTTIVAARPEAKSPILDKYLGLERTGGLLERFDGLKPSGTAFKGKDLPSRYDEVEYGIKIKDPQGDKIKLKAWKGKDLLLVYVSASCPHCRGLMKRLQAEVRPGLETILVFTAVNTAGQAQVFLDSVGTGYPHYYDFDRQFSKEYGGGIVPVSLLIRKDGSAIRYAGALDSTMTPFIKEANAGR